MTIAKSTFQDYNIFSTNLNDVSLSEKLVINTINQYSFCIAKNDPLFKMALVESDILLPDGIGIVVAVKALNHNKVTKISGSDLHKDLLDKLNKANGKSFYLGSSERTLKKINTRLTTEYPNISSGYFSPPFTLEFSDEENKLMLQKINEYDPDVLFVGMTAPKQEKWVHQHKDQINAKIICSIGAVFDFYAGTIKRPDNIWINLGLEWFIRLCREPKRMWKRYVYYGPVFMFTILKEIIKSDFSTIHKYQKKIL